MIANDQYIGARIHDSELYPNTFLDIPGQVETFSKKVRDDVIKRISTRLLFFITIIAVLFAAASTWFSGLESKSLLNTVIDKTLNLDANAKKIAELERLVNKEVLQKMEAEELEALPNNNEKIKNLENRINLLEEGRKKN